MEQKVAARISDVYNAKGESLETQETFFKAASHPRRTLSKIYDKFSRGFSSISDRFFVPSLN